MSDNPDSIGWMRDRWEERNEPAPAQFGALFSVLRAATIMT